MSNTKKSPKSAPAKKGVLFSLTGLPTGIFEQTMPETLPAVSLIGEAGTFQVHHGERIVMPNGEYHAVASYTPPEDGKVLRGSVYSKPVFVVDARVKVSEDTSSVELPIEYKCFALVCFPEHSSSYSVRGYDGAMRPLCNMFGKTQDQVAYLAGDFSFPALDVSAMNDDGVFKAVELVNDKACDAGWRILALPGHWYSINPADGTVDSGLISESK